MSKSTSEEKKSEDQDVVMTAEEFERIQALNKSVKKKFGVPLVRIIPRSQVGQGGASLAPVPEGHEAVVDVLNNRIEYVRIGGNGAGAAAAAEAADREAASMNSTIPK